MNHFKIKSKSSPPTLLVRPRPDDSGSFVAFAADGESFRAYVHRDALAFIATAAGEAAPDETIGLLAGRVCYDPQTGPYTVVMCADVARAGELDANPGYVHISAEGHASVRRRLETHNHDREVVGWFHSHPTYLARFSPVDEREQATWTDPNHLGIVFSGTESQEPFGVYRGPDSVLLRQKGPLPTPLIPERPDQPMPFKKSAAKVAASRELPPTRLVPEEGAPPAPAHMTEPSVGAASDDIYRPPRPRRYLARDRVSTLLWISAGLTVASLAGVIWLFGRVRVLERRAEATARSTAVAASSPPAASAFTPQPQYPPAASGTAAAGRSAGDVLPTPPPAALDDGPLASPTKPLAPMPGSARARRTEAIGRRPPPPPRRNTSAPGKKNPRASSKKGKDTEDAKKKEADAPKKKGDKPAPKETPKPTPSER